MYSVFKLIIYADYITLFCNLESISEANRHIVLNNEPDYISCWLACNKYMFFQANRREVSCPNLTINNLTINNLTINNLTINQFKLRFINP